MGSICEDCALRLFNKKHYNIKAIGTPNYGNMIVIPNIDKSSYKNNQLEFSKILEIINEVSLTSTGVCVTDYCYVTALIKCKETNKLELRDLDIQRCATILGQEINHFKPKKVLLLGSAVHRMFNQSIDDNINKIIVSNNIGFFANYNPNVKNYNVDKFKVFEQHFIKWCNSVKTNDFSNYEIIK